MSKGDILMEIRQVCILMFVCLVIQTGFIISLVLEPPRVIRMRRVYVSAPTFRSVIGNINEPQVF